MKQKRDRIAPDFHKMHKDMEDMHDFWCNGSEPGSDTNRMETKLCADWYAKEEHRRDALQNQKPLPKLTEEEHPPIEEVTALPFIMSDILA